MLPHRAAGAANNMLETCSPNRSPPERERWRVTEAGHMLEEWPTNDRGGMLERLLSAQGATSWPELANSWPKLRQLGPSLGKLSELCQSWSTCPQISPRIWLPEPRNHSSTPPSNIVRAFFQLLSCSPCGGRQFGEVSIICSRRPLRGGRGFVNMCEDVSEEGVRGLLGGAIGAWILTHASARPASRDVAEPTLQVPRRPKPHWVRQRRRSPGSPG